MATVNNPTWRNHYLPQSYLAHFCDSEGEVLRTFRGPDDKLHERRFVPKATGYEKDLYSFKSDGALNAGDTDYIEREILHPIDGAGISAVRKMIEHAPSHLDESEREHVARFINSMLERHPQRLRERDAQVSEMALEQVESLRKEWGPPPAGRPDVLDMIDFEAMARNMYRQHMVEQIRDTEAIDYLSGFTFLKLQIAENPVLRFLTGDDPVLVNLGKPWPIHWITLALDPCTLLIGHGFSEPMDDPETLVHLAICHNLQLFQQCEYVFSREPLDDVPPINTRRAASVFLRQVGWRKR